MTKAVNGSIVDFALCVALSIPISFPVGLYAQSSNKQASVAARSETAALKLKPEQERGLRLLKTAETESVGLEPKMRAFVLWRASYAYTKLDPKHAQKLSRDAFMA